MTTASTHHASLSRPPSDLINGEWLPLTGAALTSTNPARPDEVLWAGTPSPDRLNEAVAAAEEAGPAWRALGIEKRAAVLQRFAQLAADAKDRAAALIRDETGKAHWDAAGEAGILGGKVGITLDDSAWSGRRRVSSFDVAINETRSGRCWFRPHGVMAVLGPFNFPMHLPNGHIVPALLMGNTVVFKPSDKTPACGQLLAELFDQALREERAPKGVLNLVQGAADIAGNLVKHPGIDGILFTGSWPVGRKILEANLDRPGRIVALELGGNNPAIVMPDADLRQAAIEVVRGAFITTGQRCTCTRRLVVHKDIADRFVGAVVQAARKLVVGEPTEDGVFMGPLITAGARDAVVAAQQSQAANGGEIVLASEALDRAGHYVTPGVTRVERFVAEDGSDAGCDIETFGPLLRYVEVDSEDEALEQANATRYGLAASLFTKSASFIEKFQNEASAGCVNVNCATAGASSKLPFGGLGFSGNHRPAGAFSLDYCAYPTAGMTETGDAAQIPTGMSFDESWLEGAGS